MRVNAREEGGSRTLCIPVVETGGTGGQNARTRERANKPWQPMIEIDLSHVNNWIAVTLYGDSCRLA